MCCGTSSTGVLLPIGLPPVESPTEMPTMTFPLRVFKRLRYYGALAPRARVRDAPAGGRTAVPRDDRRQGGGPPAARGRARGGVGAARRARHPAFGAAPRWSLGEQLGAFLDRAH